MLRKSFEVLLFSSFCLLIVSEAPSESSKDDCPVSLGAAIDGRQYFMENSTILNWFEANETCTRCGYQFAEINSQLHTFFLYNALNLRAQKNDYWISARENRNKPQYLAWDKTDETLEESLFDAYYGGYTNHPLYLCGTLETKYEYGQNWVVLRPCLEPKPYLCMRHQNQAS